MSGNVLLLHATHVAAEGCMEWAGNLLRSQAPLGRYSRDFLTRRVANLSQVSSDGGKEAWSGDHRPVQPDCPSGARAGGPRKIPGRQPGSALTPTTASSLLHLASSGRTDFRAICVLAWKLCFGWAAAPLILSEHCYRVLLSKSDRFIT